MKSHERKVRAIAAELGLTVRQARRRGHLHLIAPDGRLVAVASSTPSCSDEALRQVAREARRRLGEVRP